MNGNKKNPTKFVGYVICMRSYSNKFCFFQTSPHSGCCMPQGIL
jgi:hypothetical protein